MSETVQRFVFKAKATNSNESYSPWTIADICILIGEDNKLIALNLAKDELTKRNWQPISSIDKSTLIEESVLQQPQNVIDEYNQVKEGKLYFNIKTDNWASSKDLPQLLFPRITERFFDLVFEKAGGKRYYYSEKDRKRNADYILDNYIYELKMIEEERLINETVQKKISELLIDNIEEIKISPEGLNSIDYSVYSNIFRTPIENAIKSASKQVSSTRKLLNNDCLKGGLIIVNNGTSSITPKIFNECVKKVLNNNTRNMDSYLSICIWSTVKGLDTNLNTYILPEKKNETELKLQNSFDKVLNDFYTDWVHSQFVSETGVIEPLKTISFEKYGIVFTKYGDVEKDDIK